MFGKILDLLTFRFTDFEANDSFVYFPGFYATDEPADTRIYGGTGIIGQAIGAYLRS